MRGQDVVDFGWLLSAATASSLADRRSGLSLGFVLGLVYILNAVPLYTASVDILIDKGRSQFIDQYERAGATRCHSGRIGNSEPGRADQVRAAGARGRGEAQTHRRRRVHGGQPEPGDATCWAGSARRSTGSARCSPRARGGSEDGDYDAVGDAADRCAAASNVDRTGRTYVLSVSYTAKSPELAARIAQGYGEAYLDDQLQSKYEATRRASAWLQDRIAELKQQSYEADLRGAEVSQRKQPHRRRRPTCVRTTALRGEHPAGVGAGRHRGGEGPARSDRQLDQERQDRRSGQPVAAERHDQQSPREVSGRVQVEDRDPGQAWARLTSR